MKEQFTLGLDQTIEVFFTDASEINGDWTDGTSDELKKMIAFANKQDKLTRNSNSLTDEKVLL